MQLTAIIGGSGLTQMPGLTIIEQHQLDTPFGEPSAPLVEGEIAGQRVIFLPRHGEHHTLPPHLINYRANIWALHQLGVTRIMAVVAAGGIHPDCMPGRLVVPDQIIDYTWGRDNSFFSEDFNAYRHVDFTYPYVEKLRQQLIEQAARLELACAEQGVYAVMQGPRLETAAEIRRLQRDGCDIVGMTAMPEAVLARELAIDYANIGMVANWAAGLQAAPLSMAEMHSTLNQSVEQVCMLVKAVITSPQQ